ncbi:MAG: fibronectin type III domain-containing protein [Clostridia bacterium]|nr:fibronectin type III domain-containing protein [Clostridia bacterium]
MLKRVKKTAYVLLAALTIQFTVLPALPKMNSLKAYAEGAEIAQDAERPTAPTNLVLSSKTDITVSLNWTPATDNVAVVGYEIYKNSTLVGATQGETSYSVEGLAPATTYEFTVKAKDAAGNLSEASNNIRVTTLTDDHGDSLATATPVRVSGEMSISGNIGMRGDVDFFKFIPETTGLYTIESLGTTDVDGTIFDELQLERSTNTDYGVGRNFYHCKYFVAGTVCYLKVAGNGNEHTGVYTVKLTPVSDDEYYSGGYVNSPEITIGSEVDGRIDFPYDSDTFKFIPSVTGPYIIETTGPTDTHGYLFDFRVMSWVGSPDVSSTNRNFYMSVVLTANQTYYINIEHGGNINHEPIYTGPYTLRVLPGIDDYGSSIETATPVQIGTEISGSIESFGDVDFVKFTPDRSSTYIIEGTEVIRTTADICGRLYDSAHNYIDGGSSDSMRLNPLYMYHKLEAGQTYYLKFYYDNDHTLEDYRFRIRAVDDDHSDNDDNTATNLTIGNEVNGEINYIGDRDYFKFTPTTSGPYVIRSLGTTDVEGQIFALGTGINYYNNNANATTTNFYLSAMLEANKTYYIRVNHPNTSNVGLQGTGAYRIKVSYGTDDYGNSFDTAREIQLGTDISGVIESAGDSDYFKFIPATDGVYTIETLGAKYFMTGWVYDSQRNQIAYNDAISNYNGNFNFRFNTFLKAGQTYYLKAAICYNFSIGAYKIRIAKDEQTPTIPTNLSIASKTDTSVSLMWSASTDNIGVTGYNIYRDGTKIASTANTSYTEPALEPGVYTYTVKAYDASGNTSGSSNSITYKTAVLPAPVNLTAASKTMTAVSLTWSPPVVSGIQISGYEVYRDEVKIGTTTETNYIDTNLNPSTTYSYTVKLLDAEGGISVPSSTLSITTEADTESPTAPLNLAVAVKRDTSVTLVWEASTDNTGVIGYEIYRNNSKYITVEGTTFKDEGVYPDIYVYTVKAIDAYGNSSEASNSITYWHKTVPAPTNLTVTSKTDTTVSLAWNPPEGVEGMSRYDIYRLDETTKQSVKMVSTDTAYTDSGLTPNTTYTYRLRTVCIDGSMSPYFGCSITVTTEGDTQRPTAPTGLAAALVGETSVRLTWTASTDNAGVKGYEIYRDGVKLKSESSTASTIGSLMPGSTYTFMVKAFDEVGNVSEASNVITVTTLPDTQAPAAPAELTSSSVTETSAVLSWAAPVDNVGVTGYQIYRDGVRIASASKPTFTVTRLVPGRTYVFTVKAYDLAGNVSEASNEASVTTLTDTQAPTAPVNLMASDVTATSVTLTWAASTDNAGVSGYVVYRDGVKIAIISGTTYTAAGLTAGRTYNFTVKAYDVVNCLSVDSNIVTVTAN